MREWVEEYVNISGIFQKVETITHSPIYLGLFANVPSTWHIAGRIYFVDSLAPERLLLGTDEIFYNMVHRAELIFDRPGYNIIFVPVRYLKSYTIKIGRDFHG